MQIASVVGGFSLAQADMLRRAMGKKKKEEMDKPKDQFLQGAQSKHIDLQKATQIFELCYKFAEYGFNKSHSAAYALISYQTAYLKANYAPEYMTALLSSVIGSTDRAHDYIDACQQLGLCVVPPDINHSDRDFTIQDKGIRFGLGAIKNVGEVAIDSIVEHRPYRSLMDFFMRVDSKLVNKRVVESLIKSGACDALGDRSQLLSTYEVIGQQASDWIKQTKNGQLDLFGSQGEDAIPHIEHIPTVYLSALDKLRMEKELLGVYVSGHPLDSVKDRMDALPFSISSLKPEDEGKTIALIGMLTECRQIITKTKREMLVATLEDLGGSMDVVLFANKAFEEMKPLFVDGNIVHIDGKIKLNAQGAVGMTCFDLRLLNTDVSKKVMIDTDNVELDQLVSLKQSMVECQGSLPVVLIVGQVHVQVHAKYYVSEACVQILVQQLGEGHVWVV